MSRLRIMGCAVLFVAAIVAGTAADTSRPSPARLIGGYHVLAADFHVHMFPLGWSTLSPWDTIVEARHQGLDAIALVPHNITWLAKIGRWVSGFFDRPIVIVGEEITAPDYHLLAVGIDRSISARLPVTEAIAEVHRQGGVAIAAHPYENAAPAFEVALRELDGVEVVRPEAQNDARLGAELRAFYDRAHSTKGRIAAVGDSDFHGAGPMGYSRTYVFARQRTAAAVLDAIRDGRTVVYDRDVVHGDPAMIQLAAEAGGLPRDVPVLPRPGVAAGFSRIATLVLLIGMLFLNRWQ
jgi:predicted metal-dependent phosphoesterase TrpH